MSNPSPFRDIIKRGMTLVRDAGKTPVALHLSTKTSAEFFHVLGSEVSPSDTPGSAGKFLGLEVMVWDDVPPETVRVSTRTRWLWN